MNYPSPSRLQYAAIGFYLSGHPCAGTGLDIEVGRNKRQVGIVSSLEEAKDGSSARFVLDDGSGDTLTCVVRRGTASAMWAVLRDSLLNHNPVDITVDVTSGSRGVTAWTKSFVNGHRNVPRDAAREHRLWRTLGSHPFNPYWAAYLANMDRSLPLKYAEYINADICNMSSRQKRWYAKVSVDDRAFATVPDDIREVYETSVRALKKRYAVYKRACKKDGVDCKNISDFAAGDREFQNELAFPGLPEVIHMLWIDLPLFRVFK